MPQRFAILGSEGMLGTELKKVFPHAEFFDIRNHSAKKIDISNEGDLEESLEKYGPDDWIINAAAYTNVDGAETFEGKESSFRINVLGPMAISNLSKLYGFNVIHFSTAYVFDGKKGDYRETDKTNPLSAYAIHKLLSERHILDAGGIVLRTDVLYGPNGKNFIDSMVSLSQKESLEVVNDQIGSPTYTKDLAEIAKRITLSEKSHHGKVYHSTNRGSCSRADLAKRIMEIMNSKCQIVEISTKDYNEKYRKNLQTARRPSNSSLNVQSLAFHVPIRSWGEALEDYLSSRPH